MFWLSSCLVYLSVDYFHYFQVWNISDVLTMLYVCDFRETFYCLTMLVRHFFLLQKGMNLLINDMQLEIFFVQLILKLFYLKLAYIFDQVNKRSGSWQKVNYYGHDCFRGYLAIEKKTNFSVTKPLVTEKFVFFIAELWLFKTLNFWLLPFQSRIGDVSHVKYSYWFVSPEIWSFQTENRQHDNGWHGIIRFFVM